MSHSFQGRLRRQQDIVVLWELSFHPAVENDAARNDPKIVDHTHIFFLCFGRISTGPKQGGIKIIYKISSCKDVTSAPVDVLAQKVLESSSLFGTHLFVGNLLQHVGETVRRIPITSSSPFLFNFTRTCCHSASILPMSPLPLLSAQLPRARKVIGLLEGVETSQP